VDIKDKVNQVIKIVGMTNVVTKHVCNVVYSVYVRYV